MKTLGAIVLALSLTGCAEVKCTGEAKVIERSWYYDSSLEMLRTEYRVQTPCGQATYRPGLFEANPSTGQRLYGEVRGDYLEVR